MLKGHGVGGWDNERSPYSTGVSKALGKIISIGSIKGFNMESVFVRHITGLLDRS